MKKGVDLNGCAYFLIDIAIDPLIVPSPKSDGSLEGELDDGGLHVSVKSFELLNLSLCFDYVVVGDSKGGHELYCCKHSRNRNAKHDHSINYNSVS